MPDSERITDFLYATANRAPDRDAIRDASGALTYGELASRALRLAQGLARLGVDEGDRVLVVLPNSVSFVVAHFAILTAGAVSVPCDAQAPALAIERIARSCLPTLLVTDTEGAKRLADVSPSLGVRATVVFGKPGSAPTAQIDGEELIGSGDERLPARGPRPVDEVATLMYTTGTTGEAKGVMLTSANVTAAIANICSYLKYTPDDREVVTLPISHSFGLGHVYCNLRSGGAVYLEPGLAKMGRVFAALRDFRATGFPGTPLGYSLILDRYGSVFADVAKGLRFIVVNSSALPPERAAQILALLPDVDLHVYYGLTEASRSTFLSLTREGPAYYTSVGQPMPRVDLRVEDASGEQVGRGSVGEVTIGGPTVSRGYWAASDLTARSFRGGRLHTGDLGYLDDAGFLFLTGRLSDVINVGGYKVMPAEVEAVIRECDGVLDVSVMGVDGVPGFPGTAVIAAVQGAAGFDPANCEELCRTRLQSYKVPTRFVLLDSFPRSETGKLLRSELGVLISQRVREPRT